MQSAARPVGIARGRVAKPSDEDLSIILPGHRPLQSDELVQLAPSQLAQAGFHPSLCRYTERREIKLRQLRQASYYLQFAAPLSLPINPSHSRGLCLIPRF
jgi:hypothetical protein